ncbi:MAG: hypothetical protein H7A23_18140 [Leptospiraceae bacterium]|nr:hypothetical protein [Leptospiraceae bacterium]
MINQYRIKVREYIIEYLKLSLVRKHLLEIILTIFYSSLILVKILSQSSIELTSFPDRIIGIATLSGVDISARIKIYAILLVSFPISFVAIFYSIGKFKNLTIKYNASANYRLFIISGFFIIFYSLCYGLIGDLKFHYLGYLFAIQVYSIVSAFFIRWLPSKGWTQNQKGMYLTLSLFFSVLILIFSQKMNISKPTHFSAYFGSFFVSIIVSSLFLYLYVHLLNFIYRNWSNTFKVTMFTLFPLFFLLFAPVFSAELYYILNSRSITNYSSKNTQNAYVLCIFLLFLVSHGYSYLKCAYQNKWNFKPIKFFYNAYAPLFILLLMISFSWIGTADYYIDEGTELGNRIVAVQQFYSYNKLPIIQTFPPHLFADIFGSFVYTLLSGYSQGKMLDMLVYSFHGQPVWIFPSVILFYFLFKKFVPVYFALFFVILLPHYESLLSSYYGMGFAGILYVSSNFFYKKKKVSLAKWMLFWLLLFGLFLCRIDLGVGVFLTVLCLFALMWFFNKWNFSLLTLFRSIVYTTLTIVLFFSSLCLLYGINPVERIMMIRSIMSLEGQSNSYTLLFTSYTPGFFITYFVLPIFVFLLFVVKVREYLLISSYKKETLILTTLFLCIFYFVSFTRALLRHGWFEQQIQFIFSTSFFAILSGSITFTQLKKEVKYFITLVLLLLFFAIFYISFGNIGIPNVNDTIFMRGYKAIVNLPILEKQNQPIQRIHLKIKGLNHFENFKKLLDLTLSKEETFLIFHNKDFLYAITDRLMPTYFGQVPMGYSSDKMQNYYLKEIQNIKAPLLIFEHYPQSIWDNADDVPNPIRAYRLAEYFYTKYEPFLYVDNYFIWVEKSRKNEFLEKVKPYLKDSPFNSEVQNELVFFKPQEISQQFSIGKLPYVWANYDSAIKKKNLPLLESLQKVESPVMQGEEKSFFVKKKIDKSSGNYIFIQALAPEGGSLDITYSESNATLKDKFTFHLVKSKNYVKYLIRVSSQWSWMTKSISSIQLKPNSNIRIKELSIRKGD